MTPDPRTTVIRTAADSRARVALEATMTSPGRPGPLVLDSLGVSRIDVQLDHGEGVCIRCGADTGEREAAPACPDAHSGAGHQVMLTGVSWLHRIAVTIDPQTRRAVLTAFTDLGDVSLELRESAADTGEVTAATNATLEGEPHPGYRQNSHTLGRVHTGA